MSSGGFVLFVFLAVFIGVVILALRGGARMQREAREGAERSEALFRSMFPELQPWFHPRTLIDYVLARRGHSIPAGGETWPQPPGAHAAEIRIVDGRERVRIVDNADATLAEFVYEEHPEGGVLRVGKGKLTVAVNDTLNPRVRYWHPDREFKWKRGQWTFTTPVSDSPMESSSSGTTFSDSSSSSRSSTATAAAAGAAAGMAAGAGAFDGGGASSSWDESSGSGGADSGDSGSGDSGATATATAY